MRLRVMVGTLAAAATLLTAGAPAMAAWPSQYKDVDQWPAWAIRWQPSPTGKIYTGGDLADAVWFEVMVGDPAPTGQPETLRQFRPNDTISRAEFATILSRAIGTGAPDHGGPGWYKGHVAALATDGILTDSGDWAAPISRQEMGEWIGKAISWYGLSLTGSPRNFPDLAGRPEAADIERAALAGVIAGYEDGTYRPGHTATRAEAAAMAVRLAKLLRKHAPSADELLQVEMAVDAQFTQLDRDFVEKGTADYTALAPYGTELSLQGPEGLKAATDALHAGRPEFGWATFSDFKATPILLRDTIALVHITYVSHPYMKDGEPYPGGAVQNDEYVYFVKREGHWRHGNAKEPTEYDPAAMPQPE